MIEVYINWIENNERKISADKNIELQINFQKTTVNKIYLKSIFNFEHKKGVNIDHERWNFGGKFLRSSFNLRSSSLRSNYDHFGVFYIVSSISLIYDGLTSIWTYYGQSTSYRDPRALLDTV